MRFLKAILLSLTLILAVSCASVQLQDETGLSNEVTAENYAKNKNKFGVILFDANWGRKWNCGQYQNAQLISFSFDKAPITYRTDDAPGDISVGRANRINAISKFESYALIVPSGEYWLSGFKIKTAESYLKVGYWTAGRSHLIKDGKALGGKFNVDAGEIVYIGNFALDCYAGPTLWRYYANGKQGFESQLLDYKAKYPFLDLTNAKFRLFKTETIGRDYELK